jgi:hypothetical protein
MRKSGAGTSATLGFEQKLWAAADKLRSHMDAVEYKHVVLGLIQLRHLPGERPAAPLVNATNRIFTDLLARRHS